MKRTSTILPVLIFMLGVGYFSGCTKEGVSGVETTGKGGSLAKFTIAGNNLFVIDQTNLNTYSLANPAQPKKLASTQVGFDIETIYPYKDFLFIGGRNGFYIYSISNPNKPEKLGSASHVRSCDPVVANDSIAFVTLKGGACGPAITGLYVYDIKSSLMKPTLLKTIELTDAWGLGLQDHLLYVCCGYGGLRVYDIRNNAAPDLLTTIADSHFYKDVIAYNNTLICYVNGGIRLFDITNPSSPVSIATIN